MRRRDDPRPCFRNGVASDGRPTPRATAPRGRGRPDRRSSATTTAPRPYDGADEVVDLDGALVDPGVRRRPRAHRPRPASRCTGLDLSGTPSLADDPRRRSPRFAADAPRARRARRPGLGRDRLARAAAAHRRRARPGRGGRRTYLTRVDGHSAVVSPGPGRARARASPTSTAGRADGRVERDAHHAVAPSLDGLIGPDERLDAAPRRLPRPWPRRASSRSTRTPRPTSAPSTSSTWSAGPPPRPGCRAIVYWGELMAVETARAARRRRARRRPCVDGAFGSRTAALHAPYADADTCGHAYLTAEQVARPRRRLHRAPAPGRLPRASATRALDEHPRGLRGRRATSSAPTPIRARPAPARARRDALARDDRRPSAGSASSPACSRCSTRLWGGPDGLYARGWASGGAAMNPFGALRRAGVRARLRLRLARSRRSTRGPPSGPPSTTTTEEQRLDPAHGVRRPHPRRLARRLRRRRRCPAPGDLAVWDARRPRRRPRRPGRRPARRLLRTVAAGRTDPPRNRGRSQQ